VSTATGAERRKHHRYGLPMEVTVRAKKRNATPIVTLTHDISAGGISFAISGGIEAGAELEFELKLPMVLKGAKGVHIRCRGKIVRVGPPDWQGKIGVSATIDSYKFLRSD